MKCVGSLHLYRLNVLLQSCVGLDSLILVMHTYSMHLFPSAGFMKNKLNIYNDCIGDNFENHRTRFVMSGYQIKHASTNLPRYHKHNFFCISNYSQFHNQGQG